MAKFVILPLIEEELPEAADFLSRSIAATLESRRDDARRVEEEGPRTTPDRDDLRWLLDNPAREAGGRLGEIVRDEDGAMVGMIVAVPCAIGWRTAV